MFKSLYKKLTFFNALILICFLFIFSYSIVSFYSVQQTNQAKKNMQIITAEIIRICQMRNSFSFYNINEIQISDDRSTRYLVWYNNFQLSNINNLRSNDTQLLNPLKIEAEKEYEDEENEFKTIGIEGVNYRLFTTYYELPNGQKGVIQVLQNQSQDEDVLKMMFFLFIRIGLVATIILIIISAYLAKKSLEPIRQAYNKQRQFIADASHELRTPLTVMKTSLELLSMKEEETIKENEKWFKNLESETNLMTNLVQDLLMLAQVDNNQVEINFVKVDFSLLINQVCDKMKLITGEKSIEFNSIISDEIYISGDKNRLEQLTVILIDNAIKYTPDGGKVSVNLMSTPEKAILSVKDSGLGMTEEDKRRVFDRFYRVDKVRSREQGGAGLGLSIAKWIIDEHKGKIYIESQVDVGSEFIVEFPRV